MNRYWAKNKLTTDSSKTKPAKASKPVKALPEKSPSGDGKKSLPAKSSVSDDKKSVPAKATLGDDKKK
jgi:hypothetical protein